MTRSEVLAFNAGVQTAIDLAQRTAEALRKSPSFRTTRTEFAVKLEAMAEAGEELKRPMPAHVETAEA